MHVTRNLGRARAQSQIGHAVYAFCGAMTVITLILSSFPFRLITVTFALNCKCGVYAIFVCLYVCLSVT